mmetsp:Transcript_2411/g.3493  ORF Transcript_2411/g.3493 Transcript_2411/m.3493 type:complete len:84 (+) Transcript_2411:721-972(+)
MAEKGDSFNHLPSLEPDGDAKTSISRTKMQHATVIKILVRKKVPRFWLPILRNTACLIPIVAVSISVEMQVFHQLFAFERRIR